MAGSFWKGSISFGLLNIPITLHSADEKKEIHFNQLDSKNLARVKMKRVNERTGREIPYSQIAKGFEYEKGQYVIITDEDIKAANPKATQTVDIQDFVKLEEIDPLFFEKPYYIVPQKQGEKGYFLLRDALLKEKKVAIAKVVLRTKQSLCAVMARGDYLVLELMRFAHEILTDDEVDFLADIDDKKRYSPKEMKMAEALMNDMTATWDPEQYQDTYYKDLLKRIRAKVKAGKGKELPEVEQEEEEAETSNIVDLLPLLQKSLAAKGKKGKKKAS